MHGMREYAAIVGDSWAAARHWRRAFPERPFLGVRVDDAHVAVLFEPRTTSGPLGPEVERRSRRLFEDAGQVWIDDQIYLAPTLGSGHRFARHVLGALRGYASQESLS